MARTFFSAIMLILNSGFAQSQPCELIEDGILISSGVPEEVVAVSSSRVLTSKNSKLFAWDLVGGAITPAWEMAVSTATGDMLAQDDTVWIGSSGGQLLKVEGVLGGDKGRWFPCPGFQKSP